MRVWCELNENEPALPEWRHFGESQEVNRSHSSIQSDRARRENLIRLGIEKRKAYEWSNTRKGYWCISKSYILHRSLTDKELALRGYEDISAKYQFIHSSY